MILCELQSSFHWMPTPNSLFLMNSGCGVGWRWNISCILVPASISEAMLNKVETLALEQFLYSLVLRQPILAESGSGVSLQSFMTVIRLYEKEPGCRGANFLLQSQICSAINSISGSRGKKSFCVSVFFFSGGPQYEVVKVTVSLNFYEYLLYAYTWII